MAVDVIVICDSCGRTAQPLSGMNPDKDGRRSYGVGKARDAARILLGWRVRMRDGRDLCRLCAERRDAATRRHRASVAARSGVDRG